MKLFTEISCYTCSMAADFFAPTISVKRGMAMCGFIGFIRYEKPADKESNVYCVDQQVQVVYSDKLVSFWKKNNENEPVIVETDDVLVVMNGELYNVRELSENVNVGDTTSEILTRLYKQYGEDLFRQLRGKFAMLIWDKNEKRLVGARDPFGMKSLFYSEQQEGVWFSFDKKMLSAVTGRDEVDPESLQHYFSFQYVPEPMTMSNGIRKVEAGCSFTLVDEGLVFERYFQPTFRPMKQLAVADFAKKIRETMTESVRLHMRSNAPVGSFLSGGIDSTIIASLAKEVQPNLKTFSVDFEHSGFSEVGVAKMTASELGIENYSCRITPDMFVDRLPEIIWHTEDPLADPASVALYFAAREARRHVSVVLSGEGADELFGGYTIYREPQSLRWFNSVPDVVHGLLKRVANVLPEGVKGKSFLERGTTPLKDRYIGNAKMFEEGEKAEFLKTFDASVSYQAITRGLFGESAHLHPVQQMQYIDLHTWMRGDILLKADRMTKAHDLEVRSPFLDVEVMKLASQIPVEYNLAHGTTKWVLREAFRGIIPEHVINRRKLGFPVPIRHWLKDELYEWAHELIRVSETDDYFDKGYLLTLLEKHRVGKIDYSRKIWTVLMFMIWHQVFVEQKYDVVRCS